LIHKRFCELETGLDDTIVSLDKLDFLLLTALQQCLQHI